MMANSQPLLFFFAAALRPNGCHDLLILEVSRSQTTTHHIRQDCSGQVINSSQRPPDNTQHSQQTNIHASGGIRTHDLSRRAAADLHLRPRGHWDRLTLKLTSTKNHSVYPCVFQAASVCVLSWKKRGPSKNLRLATRFEFSPWHCKSLYKCVFKFPIHTNTNMYTEQMNVGVQLWACIFEAPGNISKLFQLKYLSSHPRR